MNHQSVGNENNKQKDCSLLGTAVVSHEAAPALPCRGRIVRPGLVSPGGHLPRAEHYRRAVWAALAQRGGQRTPWGGDGSERVLSRVSTAPQSETGAEERCREKVISVRFIKRACGKVKRNWGLRGIGKHSNRGIFHNSHISNVSGFIICCI